MADVAGQTSSLFNHLRLLQRMLPPACSLGGIAYEVIEHGILAQPVPPVAFAGEILFYAIIGPLLIFWMLAWLLHRVAERDVAETRLAVLYEVSRQIAAAHSLDELQEIALSIPERVGLVGALNALISQDGPGQPWLLARTRGFNDVDVAAMQAALASRQDQPGCVPEQLEGPCLKTDCPLLRALAVEVPQPLQLAFSVSLSRESSARAMMGVYLPQGSVLPPQGADTLESLAAGLALAMDRASFRVHEQQLLHQVQRDVAAQPLGLIPTFERILADIAIGHRVVSGAVYLLRGEGREQRLACAASWPDALACEALSHDALAAIAISGKRHVGYSDLESFSEPGPPAPYVLASPITSDDEILGALVVAGQGAGSLPHPSILDVVTSMMALLIRNSQLYGRLESQAVMEERNHLAREVHDRVAQALGFYNFKVQQVQRLLGRGSLAEATLALQELRTGSQEVYEEVRQVIRDLSGVPDYGSGFAGLLRPYCATFAKRTGLEVSLDLVHDADIPPEAQVELFRVVQEALNNTHQHAGARHISIRLCREVDSFSLVVEDDGIGLRQDRATGDHFGLLMMRQRVESIGGELEVVSRTGEGMMIKARVPMLSKGERVAEELWSVSTS